MNPTPGDFVELVNGDFTKIGIEMHEESIVNEDVSKYKNHVKI